MTNFKSLITNDSLFYQLWNKFVDRLINKVNIRIQCVNNAMMVFKLLLCTCMKQMLFSFNHNWISVRKLDKQLQETGYLLHKKRSSRPSVSNETVENIWKSFFEFQKTCPKNVKSQSFWLGLQIINFSYCMLSYEAAFCITNMYITTMFEFG